MFLIINKTKAEKLLSIFVSITIICAICLIKSKNKKEIIQTSNTRNNKKVVVLDAGHGQPDRPEL